MLVDLVCGECSHPIVRVDLPQLPQVGSTIWIEEPHINLGKNEEGKEYLVKAIHYHIGVNEAIPERLPSESYLTIPGTYRTNWVYLDEVDRS